MAKMRFFIAGVAVLAAALIGFKFLPGSSPGDEAGSAQTGNLVASAWIKDAQEATLSDFWRDSLSRDLSAARHLELYLRDEIERSAQSESRDVAADLKAISQSRERIEAIFSKADSGQEESATAALRDYLLDFATSLELAGQQRKELRDAYRAGLDVYYKTDRTYSEEEWADVRDSVGLGIENRNIDSAVRAVFLKPGDNTAWGYLSDSLDFLHEDDAQLYFSAIAHQIGLLNPGKNTSIQSAITYGYHLAQNGASAEKISEVLFPPFAQGVRLGFQSEDRIYASAEYLFTALIELKDNQRIKIIAPKYIEMQRGSIERAERQMDEEFRDHYFGRSARISSRLRFAERLSKAGLKDEASNVLAEARLIAVGSAADKMQDIDEMAERYQIQ